MILQLALGVDRGWSLSLVYQTDARFLAAVIGTREAVTEWQQGFRESALEHGMDARNWTDLPRGNLGPLAWSGTARSRPKGTP